MHVQLLVLVKLYTDKMERRLRIRVRGASPYGFRLTGGRSQPVSVSKVSYIALCQRLYVSGKLGWILSSSSPSSFHLSLSKPTIKTMLLLVRNCMRRLAGRIGIHDKKCVSFYSQQVLLYTVGHKNGATFIFTTTLANVDRF